MIEREVVAAWGEIWRELGPNASLYDEALRRLAIRINGSAKLDDLITTSLEARLWRAFHGAAPYAGAEVSLSGCAPRLFGSGGATGTLGPFGLTVHVDPDMPEDTLEFRDSITGRILAKVINVGRA